jgi:protoporphyrinogen oxidase
VSIRLRDRRRLPRIAIVGGGPGGLFTAWSLERLVDRPVSITIFEASDRLGGKVWSPRFAAAPGRDASAGGISYEAGAAEFYDYSGVAEDPLRDLVESLGLATVPMGGTAVVVEGCTIAHLDDVVTHLGADARRALAAFDARCRAVLTPREIYASGTDGAPAVPRESFAALLETLDERAARRYVETLVHSDLATEPAATSLEYGLHNYLMNDPSVMRLYRIAGGNERLVEELAARLGASVRLRTTVTAVGEDPAGLRVAWQGAGQGVEHFDIVILALPIEPLRRITCTDESLAAALQAHVARHDHPAHYLRITGLFDRPIRWRVAGDDAFLMLDAFGGCCLYVESACQPEGDQVILGWLLAGAAAEAVADLPDDELVARAIATLPAAMTGLRDRLRESRVHRWIGAVSGLPGGWAPLPVDRRHRPAACHPGLFVVGDYLFDSTLNGVLDSADHVAGWVAAELTAAQHHTEGSHISGSHTEGSA